ncbi:MAG: tyrosine-type recombinase/integrase, partial [Gammaproteobacteria bacterium]
YLRDLRALSAFLRHHRSALPKADEALLQAHLDAIATPSTANRVWSSLRRFYGYLAATGAITDNPATGITPPHLLQKLPIAADTGDIEALMAAAEDDRHHAKGVRNVLLLDMMYSCGLLAQEAAQLRLDELHLEDDNGVVRILAAKRHRAREVCFGAKTTRRCGLYLSSSRPQLTRLGDDGRYF